MDLAAGATYGYDIWFSQNDFVNTPNDVQERSTMTLIARLFALSLVVTGAVASTQIPSSNGSKVGAKMSMMPVPGCDPNISSCGISGQ